MQTCRPAKCIEAMRITLLDQCTLQPVPGPLNSYTIGCIIEPNWTPEIEEGEESVVKDNCGNICLRDDRCDLTKRWNLELKIKEPDKEFLALLGGDPLIVQAGTSIGVRQLSYGACSPYVFVELFEKTDDCDTEGDAIYFRHIFPAVRLKWTGNEREGVFRILQIEGKTRDVVTDTIGTGPFDDIPAGLIVGATPTERIDYVWFEDDFIPEIVCGAQEVPEPVVTSAVYDCETDTLIITAGEGEDFSTADEISATSNFGGFTEPVTTANATTVTIANAWAIFGQDWSLQQYCVQDALNVDLGCADLDPFVEINCPPGDGFFIEDNLVGGGGESYFADVRVDSLGRSIVAATVVDPSAAPIAAAIYRFTAAGLPDPAFGTGGKTLHYFGASYDDAVGVAIDPTDGGYFLYATRDISGGTFPVLARFDNAGVLDAGWGVGGELDIPGTLAGDRAVLHAIHVEASGNIVIAWIESANGAGHVTRLDPTGAVLEDVAFPGNQTVRGLHYMADGFYVASVVEGNVTGELYASQVDLVANTHTDTTPAPYASLGYAPNATDVSADTATDTDDAFYIAGRDNAGEQQAVVARFDPNTLALDATFGVGGIATIELPAWDSSFISGIVVSQTTGDIWVVGRFETGAVYQWIVAKLDSNGALVAAFDIDGIAELNPSATPQGGYGIALNADESKVVIVGVTTTTQGYPAIGRLDAVTGALDLGFGDN